MKRLSVVIGFLILAVAVACAGPAATPTSSPTPMGAIPAPTKAEEIKALEAAAKKEGKLNLYSCYAIGEIADSVKDWEKAYPEIKVVHTQAAGGELVEKIRSESTAGIYIADTYECGMPSVHNLAVAYGLGTAYTPPAVSEPGVKWLLGAEYLVGAGKQKEYVASSISLEGMVINTKLVTPQDEPKSWQDLLDPKWKGKLIYDNPRTPGPGAAIITALRTKAADWGLPWITKFNELKPIIGSYTTIPEQVTRGEFALGVGVTASRIVPLLRQGAPVKFIQPKEGVTTVSRSHTILAKAPNPNAARLWVNWLLTKEGQQSAVRVWGNVPLRTEVPVAFPEFALEGKTILAIMDRDYVADFLATPKWVIDKDLFK